MTDWPLSPGMWDAIGLTLRLALVSSLVLLVLGIPLANWLNTSRMRGIIFIDTLVSLPGVSLSFAHTMGEFGVVLMLGGNIPGQTRVASIALYDEAQKLNYGAAHAYAIVLLAISFGILVGIAFLQRKQHATLLSN